MIDVEAVHEALKARDVARREVVRYLMDHPMELPSELRALLMAVQVAQESFVAACLEWKKSEDSSKRGTLT